MNRFFDLTLKVLKRKVYPVFFNQKDIPCLNIPSDIEGVNAIIHKAIEAGQPYMIARFGAFEVSAVANYKGVRDNPHSILAYLHGDINEWWWNKSIIEHLKNNAGFFPNTILNVQKFGELMLEDSKQVDLLGSWCKEEFYLSEELINAQKVNLGDIRPNFYWDGIAPCWPQALKGKRVLMIHPFVDTMKKQYEKRELLFPNKNFLPEYTLLTLKSVQSIGGICEFESWFDALNYMKSEMNKIEYDVCIIGCGAYGFPLAAHAKRTGHVAIHLGGITQLMYGIYGNRWINQNYWKPLFNEHWVRPSESEKPQTANNVEGACYW